MISTPMAPPTTYSEWVDILDYLKGKTDDNAVLSAMQAGSLQWQAGVAERFSRKLISVINFRINAATDKFQKDMSRSRGHEREIVQALLALRKEMSFLSKAINLPAIPEKDREQYFQLVLEQANQIQNSLEDSAKQDRSGKLGSIVKNNKVNAF